MGIGFVLITSEPQSLLKMLKELGENAFDIGKVVHGQGKVYLA